MLQQKIAHDREQAHLALPITRTATGQAYVLANHTTQHPLPIFVDDQLWHVIARHSWSGSETCYPRGKVNGKFVLLHRFVWQHVHGEIPNGYVVDHKEGNLLDCRLQSLRLLTPTENMHNQRKRSGTSSEFRGVSWCKTRKLWGASIQVSGESTRLGYHPREADAHAAAKQAAHTSFPNCYL